MMVKKVISDISTCYQYKYSTTILNLTNKKSEIEGETFHFTLTIFTDSL